MGVPGLFASYYRKYGKHQDLFIQQQELSNLKISHLFFDYNSLIHPCAHKVIGMYSDESDIEYNEKIVESKIIDECLRYTKEIVDLINPNKVYIVIDGIAPKSKMKQQRERRYKSWFAKTVQERSLWDSNNITPGTLFMKNLKNKLLDSTDYIISDSDEPGEGEHKIMKILTNLKESSSKNVCIYGLDADLILLSMLNKFSDKIILVRENIKSGGFDHVNIYTLLNLVKSQEKVDIIDYVYMTFFLGNDFLPKLPMLDIYEHGIDILIKAYHKVKINNQKLVINTDSDNIGVNWKFLERILQELCGYERYKVSKIQNDKKDSNFPVLRKAGDSLEEAKRKYYLYHGLLENFVDVSKDFLYGTVWVMNYYLGHRHQNWSWFFKFDQGPWITDLKKTVSLMMSKELSFKKDNPIDNLRQLCFVLPKDSLFKIVSKSDDLSKNLKFLNSFTKNKYLFPESIHLDLAEKRFDWQASLHFGNTLNTFDDIYDITFLFCD